MRRIARLLPLAVLLVPVHAQAATTTATYVAAAGVSSSTHLTLPEAGKVAPLGGFTVIPSGNTVGVKIEDFSSPGDISYSVCQANEPEDTPGFCGDGADDVSYRACTDGTTKKTFSGFKPGNSVSIFIFSASTSCEGIGTAGIATITH